MSALEYLQTFSDYLTAVPSGLWTLLAALIAFLGIGYQLRAHRKREQMQRTAEVRRDVCLAACKAIARAEESIRRSWSPSLSETELYDLIKDFGPATFKLHAIGGFETIKILIEYENKLLKSSCEVAADRLEVMKLKLDQDAAFEIFSECQAIRKEALKSQDSKKYDQADSMLPQLAENAQEAMDAKQRRAYAAAKSGAALADALAIISLRLVQAFRAELEFDALPNQEYTNLIRSGLDLRMADLSAYIEGTKKAADKI